MFILNTKKNLYIDKTLSLIRKFLYKKKYKSIDHNPELPLNNIISYPENSINRNFNKISSIEFVSLLDAKNEFYRNSVFFRHKKSINLYLCVHKTIKCV